MLKVLGIYLLALCGFDVASAAAVARPAPMLEPGFEANSGQFSSDIRFISRGTRTSVRLGKAGAVIAKKESTIALTFAAAANTVEPHGEGVRPTRIHYLGPNGNHRTEVFAQVRYAHLYDGIDAVFRVGANGDVEYDLHLSPSAALDRVKIVVDGATALDIGHDGELIVRSGVDTLKQRRPVAYQDVAGDRREVKVRFRKIDKRSFGFETAGYDGRYPLVIDPAIEYSTYLGTASLASITAMTADRSGNLYFTGISDDGALPLAARETSLGWAYVAKFDVTSKQLAWVSRFGGFAYGTTGGGRMDGPTTIAVDSFGNVAVGGSLWFTYAVPLASPIQSVVNTGYGADGYLLKLDPEGAHVLFGTYLGGSSGDAMQAITFDPAGNLLFAGSTNSPDLPVTSGAYSTTATPNPNGSAGGGFVGKIGLDNSLVALTYFGSSSTTISSIASGADGNPYVAGTSGPGLPVTDQAYSGYPGKASDDYPETAAFVAKFNSGLSSLTASTYLGGTGSYSARRVRLALDSGGNAYVAGPSSDPAYPVTSGLGCSLNRDSGVFLSKVDWSGASLLYSLCFNGTDSTTGLAVDSGGAAYVTGLVASAGFPTFRPIQSANPAINGYGSFLLAVADSGSVLFSTYLGGLNYAATAGLGVDPAGAIWVAGQISAGSGGVKDSFPITSDALQASPGNVVGELFVQRISDAPPALCTYGLASPFPDSGLGPLAAKVGASGGKLSVLIETLSSECPWTASTASEWIQLDQTSGFGEAPLSFNVAPSAGQERLGTIAVNGMTFIVHQGGIPCGVKIPPSLPTAPAEGGDFTADISGPDGCSWIAVPSTSWVVVPNPISSASAQIHYTVSPNISTKPRSATLTMGGRALDIQQAAALNQPPAIAGGTPAAGSGRGQVFTITASDPNGPGDIASIRILTSRDTGTANACLVEYDLTNGSVRVYQDNGMIGYGPANSQCSLPGTYPSYSHPLVLASGTSLTAAFAVQFNLGFSGDLKVFGSAVDSNGDSTGWIQVGAYSSVAVNHPPTAALVSQAQGTGAAAAISAIYTDPDGAGDLSVYELLISADGGTSNACYLRINRGITTVSTLALRSDDGTRWSTASLASMTPLSNSQCSITPWIVRASSTQVSEIFTFVVNFQPAFAGSKQVLVQATDTTGATSGWRLAGSWEVAPQ